MSVDTNKTTPSPFRAKFSSTFEPVYRILKKLYRLFLKHIALRLFSNPDMAINYAYNELPKTSAMVIGNYFMGWVLFGENQDRLIWETFPERSIITTETARIPKTVRRHMRNSDFEVRVNADFHEVIRACRRQDWTWINDPAIQIYTELNEMGYINTYEVYKDDELAGGLWGLVVGNTFAIMSMFHHVDRAGPIALGTLISDLSEGKFDMVDCGALNPHFKQYGSQACSKEKFIEKVVLGLNRSESAEEETADGEDNQT